MDTALRKFASKYFKIRAEDVTGEKKPTKRLDFQSGAACRIRTDDLPLTRRLLYQLS